jgi:hypothetical protein
MGCYLLYDYIERPHVIRNDSVEWMPRALKILQSRAPAKGQIFNDDVIFNSPPRLFSL